MTLLRKLIWRHVLSNNALTVTKNQPKIVLPHCSNCAAKTVHRNGQDHATPVASCCRPRDYLIARSPQGVRSTYHKLFNITEEDQYKINPSSYHTPIQLFYIPLQIQLEYYLRKNALLLLCHHRCFDSIYVCQCTVCWSGHVLQTSWWLLPWSLLPCEHEFFCFQRTVTYGVL